MNISSLSKIAVVSAFAAMFPACCFGARECAAGGAPCSIRVGTYNIRCIADKGDNAWEARRKDMAAEIRSLNLDAGGMQEVTPEQMAFLAEELPEFAFSGEFRNADRTSGEASPVFYRKDRFDAEKSGTFWLSETPDTPGLKGWGAACPRVCSYLILKDRRNGRRFCFANTHTDHISVDAREKGMLLVVRRMREFGKGAPIVFTGDHNCDETTAPARAVSALLTNALYATETPPAGPWRTYTGWKWMQDELQTVDALRMDIAERNSRKYGMRIDYIYVSAGTRVLDYRTAGDLRPGTKLYPSDHYPIVATIVLPPPGRSGDISSGAPDSRESAIVETALAFWRKGPFMQYDSCPLTEFDKDNVSGTGLIRRTDDPVPEMATKDRTVYTVCSSFTMDVYRNAMGWDQGGWPSNVTYNVKTNVPPDAIVFDQNNLANPERREAAAAELRSLLRPGDEVVAFTHEKWGHAMMYVGDIDGDGRGDVLHSSGRKYNFSTGCDLVEIGGNILKDEADEIFFSHSHHMCLADADRYFVIRPTRLPIDRYPVTRVAAARLKWPGLAIERTVSTGLYGSVPEGGTLEYTIQIRNCGVKTHVELPVMEAIPAGTEYVSANMGGRRDKSGNVRWTLDMPGGAVIKLRLVVKVLAKAGGRIVSGVGNVGGIPSNELVTLVQGSSLRPEDVVRLRGNGWREAVEKSGATGRAFAKAVYRDVFGRDISVPDMEATMAALSRGETPAGCVPGWFGGRKIVTPRHADRVRELRADDLTPGDVIFYGSSPAGAAEPEAMVWTGVEVLLPRGGHIEEPGDPAVTALLAKDWFFAWRPVLQ